MLNKWVANDGGGVIFVAGPIYSYQIARPGGHDLDSLLQIFPVVLKDNRLHGSSGSVGGHDTSPLRPPLHPQHRRLRLHAPR